MLLHLVDGTSEDPVAAYKTVRAELEAYGEGLAEKPEILALSKSDAMTAEQVEAQVKALKRAAKKTPLVMSAQSREGVPQVLRALLKVIDADRVGSTEQADAQQSWRP